MAKQKQVTIEQLVQKMKDEEKWNELGWMFWNVFMTYPKNDPKRLRWEACWKALTPEQKKLCEAV